MKRVGVDIYYKGVVLDFCLFWNGIQASSCPAIHALAEVQVTSLTSSGGDNVRCCVHVARQLDNFKHKCCCPPDPHYIKTMR